MPPSQVHTFKDLTPIIAGVDCVEHHLWIVAVAVQFGA